MVYHIFDKFAMFNQNAHEIVNLAPCIENAV